MGLRKHTQLGCYELRSRRKVNCLNNFQKERQELGLIDIVGTPFSSRLQNQSEPPRASGGSFIYNRSSNWPIAEPWGTPFRQGASSDRTPSIRTWYNGSEISDLIQLTTVPWMPKDFSLAGRNRWFVCPVCILRIPKKLHAILYELNKQPIWCCKFIFEWKDCWQS